MDCKDLMIGDWVYNKHHKKNIQITPYDFFNHGHNGFGKQFLPTNPKLISGNDFDPIPITEEILAKNGFGYAYNEASEMQNKQLLVANIGGHYIEVRLDKKNVAIWYDYDENGDGVYSDVLIGLPHHVHKFQHLLRLVGIEKEIEL